MIVGEVHISAGLAGIDLTNPLSATRQAILECTSWLRDFWIAAGQDIADRGGYWHGIAEPEVGEDGLSVTVVNTARHAAVIENGHGGFHLPSAIDWSKAAKVKVSKNGVRYLTIPFRHSTPGRAGGGSTRTAMRQMMPDTIATRAKKLEPSFRLEGGGYDWAKQNGRLTMGARAMQPTWPSKFLKRDVVGYKPHWTTGRFEGMVKMVQQGQKVSSGQYMTFRTLTENSPKWNIPPMAGRHIVALHVLTPGHIDEIREKMAAAIAHDLWAAGGGVR